MRLQFDAYVRELVVRLRDDPEMHEQAERIKAAIPNQPIVIASAHSMASDRERFLAAGADDILSKPFRLADLVAIVGRLTAGK